MRSKFLVSVAAGFVISASAVMARSQLPNPAATLCAEQGGVYRVFQDEDGERGVCALPDGREVDAWERFRNAHGALPSESKGRAPADRIWTGGPIVTMVDDRPRAEALAEKDGSILAVGSEQDVLAYRGPETEMIDLAGHTMIPGFVDAHGHVFMVGIQALSANLLPAPDGPVNDIAALKETLVAYAAAHSDRVQRAGLMMGFGYDDAQLAEQRHPTRDDLDEVSTEMPVFALHQSGHLSVANSKALEIAGITAATPDPAGGVIRRRSDSDEPNGVLEENASSRVALALLRNLDAEAARAIFRAGIGLVKSYGYTTAQEGRSNPAVTQLMRAVASDEGLPIDVVTYPDVLVDRDFILESASRDYTSRFRVGGAKLTIDGSPQGFTALRDRPYYDPPANLRADYKGYASATADQVFDAVDWAFANDVQILVHANGEGASDMLIAAIETATEKYGRADRRPVLIHGQFVREDQIDAYQRLDVFPSLFPMHTFYWGDWHRDRTVGPKAADDISPTGWVRERGMMFSSHHDAPVAFPDSIRVLDATVNRRSRSGDIIGPAQRVDVVTALKALTIWPAYQHFEEATKGSLEPGKLADLVILSDDPTAIDPGSLAKIHILETIKEGETVYRADGKPRSLAYRPLRDGAHPFAAFLKELAAAEESEVRRGDASSGAPPSRSCVPATLTSALTAAWAREGR